jgi:predicted YcjX-like family ATPase
MNEDGLNRLAATLDKQTIIAACHQANERRPQVNSLLKRALDLLTTRFRKNESQILTESSTYPRT